jgi:hypothetical protein
MSLSAARKRFIEHMTPGQRDAEIIDAITSPDGRALGEFREVTFDDTPYVALADVNCGGVVITNTSGKNIFVKRGAGAVPITIPNNSGKRFDVIDNANELSVANATDAATVSVQYECLGEVV